MGPFVQPPYHNVRCSVCVWSMSVALGPPSQLFKTEELQFCSYITGTYLLSACCIGLNLSTNDLTLGYCLHYITGTHLLTACCIGLNLSTNDLIPCYCLHYITGTHLLTACCVGLRDLDPRTPRHSRAWTALSAPRSLSLRKLSSFY